MDLRYGEHFEPVVKKPIPHLSSCFLTTSEQPIRGRSEPKCQVRPSLGQAEIDSIRERTPPRDGWVCRNLPGRIPG